MGLGGVAIAVLPSMIYPKQPFSDGLGGGKEHTQIYCLPLPPGNKKSILTLIIGRN